MFIENGYQFFQGRKKAVLNGRGISLLEAMIAVFLTTVGIMAVMSMQPNAWKAAAKADYLGRAAMILSAEIERQQTWIMNPCNSVNAASTTATVRSSGQDESAEGDAVYLVTTTIAGIGANIFSVTVTVRWNNGASEITERTNVIRQEPWRFPEGCPDA